MPLYRKQSGGSGGGIAAVTLVHPDGTSEVFDPAADTDAARGTALGLAVAAKVAGDLILLGVGGFDIAFTAVNALKLRGQGLSTTVRGALLAAFNLTAGTSQFSDLTIEGGIPMAGGTLEARNCRIKGAAAGACIARTGAVGDLTLKFCDLKAGIGAGFSITSGGSNFVVNTVGTTADLVPDGDVALITPEGFSVNANYA